MIAQQQSRWTWDPTALEAHESGVLDLRDFYFTADDYRYQFELEAKRLFLGLLRERFNSGVRYKGRAFKWDTVIEQKTAELGRYLVGRSSDFDFSEPAPDLHMTDDKSLRRRILDLSQSGAQSLGIGRSTLHYLRRNATLERPFRVYGKVRQRLDSAHEKKALGVKKC
jgi:hypothetical protein